MKKYLCPVCKINPARITPQRRLKMCQICEKAIDGASGKPWVKFGNFVMPAALAKKLEKAVKEEERSTHAKTK